ncbi:uncharacterized protein RCO7_05575 [Rhynchosporium graminicola]|uniref:Uncharacterized protein n=1 Tax=Rhynchosporium graminicola TaxID=2792576 RepID=A0A1E1LKW8_9HELO|nr:uncharacterized protein RCO7_05575 [Rhynchosporium commune]
MGVTPLYTTNGPYLAVKILQGFFGAPVESLCEISMKDIWFSHERPLCLAVYGLRLAFASKFAPVLAAFINTNQGWEWTPSVTNYDRKLQVSPSSNEGSTDNISKAAETVLPSKKNSTENTKTGNTHPAAIEAGQVFYPRKTFWQKLSVIDKTHQSRVWEIMWFVIFPH